MPKISALPPAGSLADDDETPFVDDSVSTTKKFTLTNLKTYLQSLSAWVSSAMLAESFLKGRRQNNTTNVTVSGYIIQTGWGYVTGDGSVGVQKTVTFPTAFSGAPIVQISYAGARLVSAGTPTSITDFNGSAGDAKRYAAESIVTTTGFEATAGDQSNTVNTVNYAFTWIAIGPA